MLVFLEHLMIVLGILCFSKTSNGVDLILVGIFRRTPEEVELWDLEGEALNDRHCFEGAFLHHET